MNVAQLSNYYRSLAVFNARQEQLTNAVSETTAASSATDPSRNATAGSASGGTAATQDTVEISDAATKANAAGTLNEIEKSLRELKTLADLAAQGELSAEFSAQLNTKGQALAKALDTSLTDDSGKKFSELIDLSSPAKAQGAASTIDEGLKAISDKRQELGLTPASSETTKTSDKATQEAQLYEFAKAKSEWTVEQYSTLLGSLSASSAASSLEKLYSIIS